MHLADNFCSFLYHDYVTCRTSSNIITVCCCAVNRATGKKWGQVTFSSTCPIGQVLLKVSVEPCIDCWIVNFGRILMYLNVTWNMVCHKLKNIYRQFHVHVVMKPFRIWTKWKQNPHRHDIVNICPELQSSIHIHYKVTGLKSFEKLYPMRFLLTNGPYHVSRK